MAKSHWSEDVTRSDNDPLLHTPAGCGVGGTLSRLDLLLQHQLESYCRCLGLAMTLARLNIGCL